MAKIRCKCGAILRDDDPHDRCQPCGRLWIFWDDYGEPSEYVEVRES